MRRFLGLLAASTLLLGSRAIQAQTPASLGGIAATYSINATKILADPVRDRVYALSPSTSTVVVIDTTTLQTTDVAVGSLPVDMALSPDSSTLYTANGGSTASAVSMVNLNTLTTSSVALGLPSTPTTIAAGPQGRVYVFLTGSTALYQLDTTTGALTTPFAGTYSAPLQAGPDGKTLFVVNASSGELETFDVSTASPVPLATSTTDNSDNPKGYTGQPLVISHNGMYFAGFSEDNNVGAYNTTPLFSAADLTSIDGAFINSESAGALAFSLDDSLVYQARYVFQTPEIDVFSTQTFDQLPGVVTFPLVPITSTYANSSAPYIQNISAVVVDRTGSYLFLNGQQETYRYNDDLDNTYVPRIVAVTTGAGTLTPASLLPEFTGSLSTTGTAGVPFTYQITAANMPTSYAASGLPPGLSLDPATGLISGTPTTVTTDYGYAPQPIISATNANGTISSYLFITIYAAPVPVITSATTATAVVGQPFSYQVTGSNNPTYFYIDISVPGLSTTSGGLIFGTPTAGGTYYAGIQAGNSGGISPQAELTITITDPRPIVDIRATVPTVGPHSGEAADLVIHRRGGDLSQQLVVTYMISGNSVNGEDYLPISGVQGIQPGRTKATIQIISTGHRHDIARNVRLTLQPGANYQIGGAASAKVVIEPRK